MRVLSAQFYQAIKFAGQTLTYVNVAPESKLPALPQGAHYGQITATLVPGLGVQLEGSLQKIEDCVLVPFNNVPFIKVAQEQAKSEQAKPKKA